MSTPLASWGAIGWKTGLICEGGRSVLRLFVGYSYRERDKWVEELVIPLLLAFGCDVVTGKEVYGGPLSSEVSHAIAGTDAMLGFTTRRDPAGGDTYNTHPWVVAELTLAYGRPMPWVEVREDGVIAPGGFVESADAQRVTYQEANRSECLVKIAQAVRRLHDRTNVTLVRLGPAAAVDQISPLLDDPSFRCECLSLRGAVQLPPRDIPVLPIRGGLFVQLRGLEPGELVRLRISARGRTWRSSYESVDTVDVQVRE